MSAAAGGFADSKSSFIDDNFISFVHLDGAVDGVPEEINSLGKKKDDTYKFSLCRRIRFANKTIRNDVEDCLDLVRVNDSKFWNFTLEPRGRNGVTIKGSSSGNLIDVKLLCHGSECDIELGQFDNYWYPGRPPTRNNEILAEAIDGRPVVVRVWDAEFNGGTFKPGVKVTTVPKWIWFPYFIYRYAQIRITNVVRRLRGQTLVKTS